MKIACQVVVREPAQRYLDPVSERKSGLLDDRTPVALAHERENCSRVGVGELLGNLSASVFPVCVGVAFRGSRDGHGEEFMSLCGLVAPQSQVREFRFVLEHGQRSGLGVLLVSGQCLDQLFQLPVRLRCAAKSQAQPAMFGVFGLAAFRLGEVELILNQFHDGFVNVRCRVTTDSSVIETLSCWS